MSLFNSISTYLDSRLIIRPDEERGFLRINDNKSGQEFTLTFLANQYSVVGIDLEGISALNIFNSYSFPSKRCDGAIILQDKISEEEFLLFVELKTGRYSSGATAQLESSVCLVNYIFSVLKKAPLASGSVKKIIVRGRVRSAMANDLSITDGYLFLDGRSVINFERIKNFRI